MGRKAKRKGGNTTSDGHERAGSASPASGQDKLSGGQARSKQVDQVRGSSNAKTIAISSAIPCKPQTEDSHDTLLESPSGDIATIAARAGDRVNADAIPVRDMPADNHSCVRAEAIPARVTLIDDQELHQMLTRMAPELETKNKLTTQKAIDRAISKVTAEFTDLEAKTSDQIAEIVELQAKRSAQIAELQAKTRAHNIELERHNSFLLFQTLVALGKRATDDERDASDDLPPDPSIFS